MNTPRKAKPSASTKHKRAIRLIALNARERYEDGRADDDAEAREVVGRTAWMR